MTSSDIGISNDRWRSLLDSMEIEYKTGRTASKRIPPIDVPSLLIDTAKMIYEGRVDLSRNIDFYNSKKQQHVIDFFNTKEFATYVKSVHANIASKIRIFYGNSLDENTLSTIRTRYSLEVVFLNRGRIISLNRNQLPILKKEYTEEFSHIIRAISYIEETISKVEGYSRNTNEGVAELRENQESFCCQASEDSGGVNPSFTP